MSKSNTLRLICLGALVMISFALSTPSQADEPDELTGICSWYTAEGYPNTPAEEEEGLTLDDCNYWCYDDGWGDPEGVFGKIPKNDMEQKQDGYCGWIPDFSQWGPLTPPGGYNTCPDGTAPGLYGCDPEKH